MRILHSRLLLPALLVCGCHQGGSIDYSGPVAGWDEATGTKGGGQFSPLTQIDKSNVHRLHVAWTYQAPDPAGGRDPSKGASSQSGSARASAIVENTPIIAGGRMLLCTPRHRVIALDPMTGRELWNYDPKIDPATPVNTCRGVASWHGPEADNRTVCGSRVFSTTGDGRLVALDLESGRPCQDFGSNGEVDMKQGLGPIKPTEYFQTAPPLVVNDLVLAGSGVRDDFRKDIAGGVVRAWDVRSGKLVWAWDAVGPGMQPVTAEDVAAGKTFTRGTPNVWSFMSADLERGLIYLPTGNAPLDYFKGARRDIDAYGSSVVALDATSGKVVWSFQTVHHDLWDYDIGGQPVLYEHAGKIPALAVATKPGHIFLLNRLTGKPVFPVEERPVPATDVPGEWNSPTQPFPTLPEPVLAGRLTEKDLHDYPFFSKGCSEKLQSLRNEGLFTPPSLQGTLSSPGPMGGFNWGSGSINPQTGTLVTTYLNLPFVIKLIPRTDGRTAEADDNPLSFFDAPQYGTPYKLHREMFFSEKKFPCIKLPWGSIMAIDLKTGRELWRKPLGSMNGHIPLIGSWLNVGVPVIGGTMQTASGLAFVGASADEMFRAFDTQSGKELWSTRLPFSAHATPMTYRLSKTGKQFVVIATGGAPGMDTRLGNTVVAFTLPD